MLAGRLAEAGAGDDGVGGSKGGGATHGTRMRGIAIMDLLPHDMLLKVFDSTRFRPVDLLVCSSCCRQALLFKSHLSPDLLW